MSDGHISAKARGGSPVSSLDLWKEKTGTIFLSREDIARLAESGSHCLILSLPDDSEKDYAPANRVAVTRRQRLMRTTLHAIAIGACIGASTGLSVASTFLVMTHKAPVSVVAILEQALTLFA